MKKYTLFALIVVGIIFSVGYVYWPKNPEPQNSASNINPINQVFDVKVLRKNESNIDLNFVITPGFYIYKQRLKITTTPNGMLDLSHLSWPATLSIPNVEDPAKSEEVFTGAFGINLPVIDKVNQPFTLHITLQGCDGKSICYPPQTYHFEFNQDRQLLQSKSSPSNYLTTTFTHFYHGDLSWQDLVNELSIIQLIIIFFIAGVAIALTPCMYPLYPIALTTIMGNATKRTNIAFLVLMYMHGIALVYVIIGIVAGLSGKLFTTTIQTQSFMFINAGIWLILGLAMFDIIEIKLPHWLHNYIHSKSNSLKGGRSITVFIMGMVSSLLLGPCVTPPLIAAIGFIVGLGNIGLGIICLYAISLGMGVPLLALALLGGRFMPRSGKWMSGIKYLMGILLIGVSISLVYPYFSRNTMASNVTLESGVVIVDNSAQLKAAIKQSTKPVLIDFYASWCAICKEMDKKTFPDTRVKNTLSAYTVIKFDLTNNTSDQAQVLQEYGLYGPPALIILNAQHVIVDKLLGYTDSITLVNRLGKISKE